MESTLFTTLTANEEVNFSGGKGKKSVKVTVKGGSAINGAGAINGSSSVNGGPGNTGEITPGDAYANNTVNGGTNIAGGVIIASA
ncbi:hypothetical protein RIVM261_012060 [Rivularia sp. IAM M-261]|nr:hypothetical protein RIVM261_012060 [Rivularia sp. IAM M-261]